MLTTIPASNFVQVIPSVEGLAGSPLAMIGLVLTSSTRVPINSIVPLGTPTAVANYFGASSSQATGAGYYFAGYDNSDVKPLSILFTQYPTSAVQAWARGAPLYVSLATLQTYTGNTSVVIDGNTWTATGTSLASATSFSNAASLLQTAITASPPTGSSSTTSTIAATTNAFTGSIYGNTLTITAISSGLIVPGTTVTGTGVTSGTIITSQLTGTNQGVGTYSVNISQTVASESMTGAYGLFTAGTVTGVIGVGQVLSGTGVTANTTVYGLGTGTGGTGTYYVAPSGTTASATIAGAWAKPTVTWDSTSSAFVITSGVYGATSTIAAPTGSLMTSLNMTATTGVTLSQGSAAVATPAAFMTNLLQETVDFATFFTDFDPDFGGGNAVKQAFALWNSQQNGEFCYICLDSDPNPSTSATATSSLGYLLKNANTSGTFLLWQTANPYLHWVVSGFAASINWNEYNGRITFAYKGQSGLVPDVTNATTMNNLVLNGYNCYVAVATAAQQFNYLWPGSITGPFLWADSFINQIWMNAALQLSLMELLTTVKSIPYNAAGYALVDAACQAPIQAALFFGAIRTGVPLSLLQAAEVNNSAGVKIDTILATVGYYLQILPATAQVRQLRQSPPISLFYMDGQSIQTISLASIEIP